MEAYFVHKCVSSDAVFNRPTGAPPPSALPRAPSPRCEHVVVQEPMHATGASRAIVASILAMTLRSNKAKQVVVFALDPALANSSSISKNDKLTVVDYSADWQWLDPAHSEEGVTSATSALELLDTRLMAILSNEHSPLEQRDVSTRSTIVIIDSLNVLLEQYSLEQVSLWLKKLRRDPRIGSVITRVNTAAAALLGVGASVLVESVGESLEHEATAVVHVETPSSLRSYPVLAKERRREIPKRMDGMVQLLRRKKNGRTSESIEFFQLHDRRVEYFDGTSTVAMESAGSSGYPLRSDGGNTPQMHSSSSNADSGPALPVSTGEVSFNLSISASEQAAKRDVLLPYMRRGDQSVASSTLPSSSIGDAVATSNSLILIDEDDPDWDDDDLDDDLDI